MLGQFMFHHSVDAAAARTLSQRIFQFSQLLRLTSSNNFNVPLLGVSYPPTQTNLSRLPLNKPAKSNTLHATLHEVMAHHGIFSVAEHSNPRKATSLYMQKGRVSGLCPNFLTHIPKRG
jgi:hypothetical protein